MVHLAGEATERRSVPSLQAQFAAAQPIANLRGDDALVSELLLNLMNVRAGV
jgi:hypothetical protein